MGYHPLKNTPFPLCHQIDPVRIIAGFHSFQMEEPCGRRLAVAVATTPGSNLTNLTRQSLYDEEQPAAVRPPSDRCERRKCWARSDEGAEDKEMGGRNTGADVEWGTMRGVEQRNICYICYWYKLHQDAI